jgi:dihydroorotate dehydrogenase
MSSPIKTRAISFLYRFVLKPILFRFDAQDVHDSMTFFGAQLGKQKCFRTLTSLSFNFKNASLHQTILGIDFKNPIGLSAGFDYRAQLTEILPSIGMGYGTVGTISNKPYNGNPKPMLGRLPKSKSLLVNKGFKNDGIDALIKQHQGKTFSIPIGLSLGKTNQKEPMTQEEAVQDVVNAFKKAVNANLSFSYFELNISCPNLIGNISFYPTENLKQLLTALATIQIHKPIFIKMPITETDEATRSMLKTIEPFPFIKGVIFGNLWKDRSSSDFDTEEITKATKGNFSGKPTFTRSNELIALAYKEFGHRFVVIGCGGVFSAEDAYKKIRLGASLVQMITGMIYEGPQVVGEINRGLVAFLKRDGFVAISDAIGVDVK